MVVTPKLVLGSASPRRLDLLAQIGVKPSLVVPADIDESTHDKELPRVYAERMAIEKAQALRPTHDGAYILTADTVVAVGRRILPKTEEGEAEQARACHALISGRRHKVIGAICLVTPDGQVRTKTSETQVKTKRLVKNEMEAYLETGEWHGKAGGYAIQGQFAKHISWISGSYTNVVGLDLHLTSNLLDGTGYFAGLKSS